MGVGAGLYMYVVVVQKFTFAVSSPDEFLSNSLIFLTVNIIIRPHRSTTYVDAAYHYRPMVCWSVTVVSVATRAQQLLRWATVCPQ